MSNQSEEGLLSPLLRRRRLIAVVPHLRGNVLDIGCGVGALACYVPEELYFGVDIDDESLSEARRRHVRHHFSKHYPAGELFNTVVALAVLEHLECPERELGCWRQFIAPGGRLVLTTPHPLGDKIHRMGAAIGLFSSSAAEEHTTFLDREALSIVAHRAGLQMFSFKRFLAGFNQIAILERME